MFPSGARSSPVTSDPCGHCRVPEPWGTETCPAHYMCRWLSVRMWGLGEHVEAALRPTLRNYRTESMQTPRCVQLLLMALTRSQPVEMNPLL